MWAKSKGLLLVFGLLPALAWGQEWLGLTVSSYSGMHAAISNPAMLGITRNRLQVGLVGVNSQFTTNLFAYTGVRDGGTPFKGYELLANTYSDIKNNKLGSGLKDLFSPNNWSMVQNNDTKYLAITGEVRGPFLAGTFGKFGWGLGYRLRAAVQVSNLSPVIANLFFANQQQIYSAFLNQQLKDKGFVASVNAYHEYYGTLAFPVLQLGPHYIGGGVTLKYLAGMYSAAIASNGLSYKLLANDSLLTTQADVSYQYINSPTFAADPTASRGGGAAVDIGFVYELRNRNDGGAQYAVGQGTHKIRAGLSLLDAGRITYTGSARRFDFQNVSVPTTWGSIDTLKVRGTAGLDSVFKKVYGAANQGSAFYTGLPTVMNVFGDLQIIKYFYVSAMASQKLGTVAKGGLKSFSTFTIMPRLEHRLVEVGLPLTISTQYGTLLPGFYFRVSGFYLGSDNLSTLFGTPNRTGLSLYVGGYVPMRR